MRHEVLLEGCRRQPLADYLKGLGIFRIVAEQVDPDARAWWERGAMWLRSTLDRDQLVELFASRYVPTPIVAPWNGGSGFYAKDPQEGIREIEQSSSERFAPYRQAIATCRDLVARAALTERPEAGAKPVFLEQVRAAVDDATLRWLDAAVALEEDGPAYPPLLGTGGNDGRLDFSNNQMQRLAELLISSDGARDLFAAAVFAVPAPGLSRAAIGQFRPISAGGANAGEGFDRKSLVNPWDYVLALEGALVFAVAITRRLESAAPGTISFPFTVRASGVGYGSAARSDEADARAELWLPSWSHPASFWEIRTVFAEGRATISGPGSPGARGPRSASPGGPRPARTGVDFARAIATLGVDRGIDEFTRIGFLVRNGLSYFATPLGEWSVARVPNASLLVDIDGWLAKLSSVAGSRLAPSALRRAAGRVDAAVLGLCRRDDPRDVAELLIALGGVEAVCARSVAAREVPPLPRLSPEWLAAADDESPELRLAAALAAGGLRAYQSLARARGSHWAWAAGGGDGDQVWSERGLVANLVAVARRREARGAWPPLAGPAFASLDDLAAFIAGDVDDARVDALAWGMGSLAWDASGLAPGGGGRALPAAFALCRLALEPRPQVGVVLPHTRGIVARLASGDALAATRLATRRLRSAGLVPRCGPIAVSPSLARRSAAALVFPIAGKNFQRLLEQLVRTTSLETRP